MTSYEHGLDVLGARTKQTTLGVDDGAVKTWQWVLFGVPIALFFAFSTKFLLED